MEAVRRIGLRELKEHTGRVVRDVSTSGEPIDITSHGKTIARIVPADEKSRERPVYISGTRLKVWHVIQTHRLLGSDEQATADYFEIARTLSTKPLVTPLPTPRI